MSRSECDETSFSPFIQMKSNKWQVVTDDVYKIEYKSKRGQEVVPDDVFCYGNLVSTVFLGAQTGGRTFLPAALPCAHGRL